MTASAMRIPTLGTVIALVSTTRLACPDVRNVIFSMMRMSMF